MIIIHESHKNQSNPAGDKLGMNCKQPDSNTIFSNYYHDQMNMSEICPVKTIAIVQLNIKDLHNNKQSYTKDLHNNKQSDI